MKANIPNIICKSIATRSKVNMTHVLNAILIMSISMPRRSLLLLPALQFTPKGT